jgi:hypothetical protein
LDKVSLSHGKAVKIEKREPSDARLTLTFQECYAFKSISNSPLDSTTRWRRRWIFWGRRIFRSWRSYRSWRWACTSADAIQLLSITIEIALDLLDLLLVLFDVLVVLRPMRSASCGRVGDIVSKVSLSFCELALVLADIFSDFNALLRLCRSILRRSDRESEQRAEQNCLQLFHKEVVMNVI